MHGGLLFCYFFPIKSWQVQILLLLPYKFWELKASLHFEIAFTITQGYENIVPTLYGYTTTHAKKCSITLSQLFHKCLHYHSIRIYAFDTCAFNKMLGFLAVLSLDIWCAIFTQAEKNLSDHCFR